MLIIQECIMAQTQRHCWLDIGVHTEVSNAYVILSVVLLLTAACATNKLNGLEREQEVLLGNNSSGTFCVCEPESMPTQTS